jgi:hypothetical protein
MKILYVWFTPDRKEVLIYVIMEKYIPNEYSILMKINRYVLNYYIEYLGLPLLDVKKYLHYWPISDLNIDFACYWHTLDYEIGFIHEYLPFNINLLEYKSAIELNNPVWYDDIIVIPKPTYVVIHIRNKTIDNLSPFLER